MTRQERGDVGLDYIRRQRDRVTCDDERGACLGTKRLAQDEERLAERIAGGPRFPVAPEEGGQLVSGVRLILREGEVSEEALRFLRRNG